MSRRWQGTTPRATGAASSWVRLARAFWAGAVLAWGACGRSVWLLRNAPDRAVWWACVAGAVVVLADLAGYWR